MSEFVAATVAAKWAVDEFKKRHAIEAFPEEQQALAALEVTWRSRVVRKTPRADFEASIMRLALECKLPEDDMRRMLDAVLDNADAYKWSGREPTT